MSICLEVMRCYGHQVSGYQCISCVHSYVYVTTTIILTYFHISEWYQGGIRMVTGWLQDGIRMVAGWLQQKKDR